MTIVINWTPISEFAEQAARTKVWSVLPGRMTASIGRLHTGKGLSDIMPLADLPDPEMRRSVATSLADDGDMMASHFLTGHVFQNPDAALAFKVAAASSLPDPFTAKDAVRRLAVKAAVLIAALGGAAVIPEVSIESPDPQAEAEHADLVCTICAHLFAKGNPQPDWIDLPRRMVAQDMALLEDRSVLMAANRLFAAKAPIRKIDHDLRATLRAEAERRRASAVGVIVPADNSPGGPG